MAIYVFLGHERVWITDKSKEKNFKDSDGKGLSGILRKIWEYRIENNLGK